MRRACHLRTRLTALTVVALAAAVATANAGQMAPATTPTEEPATTPATSPTTAPATTPTAAPTAVPTTAPAAAPATTPTTAPTASPGAPAAAPAAPPGAPRSAAPGATPATGPATTLYVIEQLVANVNSTPDAGGERIATAKSGERVEVLERQRDQVHVRLSGGREGWIRASFLSSAEPLRERLTQREAEVAQLRAQLASLQTERGAQAAGTSNATASHAASAADPGEPPPGVLFSTAEEPRRVWPWALGAWLVGLVIGAALGVLALDRHIRRRYGGLRIY